MVNETTKNLVGENQTQVTSEFLQKDLSRRQPSQEKNIRFLQVKPEPQCFETEQPSDFSESHNRHIDLS